MRRPESVEARGSRAAALARPLVTSCQPAESRRGVVPPSAVTTSARRHERARGSTQRLGRACGGGMRRPESVEARGSRAAALARPLVTSCQPAESRRGVVPPSAVTTSARRHERARGSTQRLGRACGGGMRRPESVEARGSRAAALARPLVTSCQPAESRRGVVPPSAVTTSARRHERARGSTQRLGRACGGGMRRPESVEARGSRAAALARPLVTSCQPAESRRGVVPPSAVTTSARRHERARGSTQRLGRACGGGMRRPESVEARGSRAAALARPLVTSCQPAESRRGVVPPSAVTTSARRHERARGSTQRLGRACGGGMRRPEAMEAAARQAFARSPSRDVVPTCGVTTGRRATFGSHDVGTTSREGARLDSTAWARVRRRHASPGVGGSARQPRGSPRSPSRDVVPTCGVTTGRRATFGSHDVGTTSREGARLDSTAWARVRRRHASPGVGGSARQPRGSPRSPSRDVVPTCGVTTGRRATFGSHDVGTTSREGARLDSTAWARVRRRHASPGVGGSARQPRGSPRSPSRDVVPTCGVTTGRRATFGSHDVGTTSREGARLDSTAWARVRRRHASPGVGGSARQPRGSPRSPSRDVVPTCGVTTGRRATFGSHDVGTTSREGARLDSTAWARVRRRHASPGVGGSARQPRGSPRSPSRDVVPTCGVTTGRRATFGSHDVGTTSREGARLDSTAWARVRRRHASPGVGGSARQPRGSPRSPSRDVVPTCGVTTGRRATFGSHDVGTTSREGARLDSTAWARVRRRHASPGGDGSCRAPSLRSLALS